MARAYRYDTWENIYANVQKATAELRQLAQEMVFGQQRSFAFAA